MASMALTFKTRHNNDVGYELAHDKVCSDVLRVLDYIPTANYDWDGVSSDVYLYNVATIESIDTDGIMLITFDNTVEFISIDLNKVIVEITF